MKLLFGLILVICAVAALAQRPVSYRFASNQTFVYLSLKVKKTQDLIHFFN
jgi:hypothetical protein